MSKGVALVTGVSGYIAARTAEAFLQAGYSVRATGRSTSSSHVQDLVKYFDKEFPGQFEPVAVPDITAPGAFDEAVKGVTTIAHLAAPVSSAFIDDPAVTLKAAIHGSLRVLESAITEPSIQSFVYMSSIAAVRDSRADRGEPYTFSEADWNDEDERIVAEGGAGAQAHVYAASKAAAEKAVWRFVEENKPSFGVTAVNPTFVAGPPLLTPSSASAIPPTTKIIYNVLSGAPLSESFLLSAFPCFVDVRDVARVTVFAADPANRDKVDRQRFIVGPYYSPPQAVADILRKKYPEEETARIEKGTPGKGYSSTDYGYPKEKGVDASKAVRVTGQEYIPWEKTVLDTAEQLRGLLVSN